MTEEGRRILVRYNEIALKTGPPRRRFEDALMRSMEFSLSRAGISGALEWEFGRLFVRVAPADSERACAVLSRVFGVMSVSPIETVEFSDIGELARKCAALVAEAPVSFAVRARRAGDMGPTSMEVAKAVGSEIVRKFGSKVDLDGPAFELFVEVRGEDRALVFTQSFPGPSGLPYGSEGKIVSIIDGSDPSVLAAWEMMKRGCAPIFLHPSSGPESLEAALRQLARIRDRIPTERIRVFVSPRGAPPLDAAESLASRQDAQAISFGDTAEALPAVLSDGAGPPRRLPVFRPLLFLSKDELDAKKTVLDPPPGAAMKTPFVKTQVGNWEAVELG